MKSGAKGDYNDTGISYPKNFVDNFQSFDQLKPNISGLIGEGSKLNQSAK